MITTVAQQELQARAAFLETSRSDQDSCAHIFAHVVFPDQPQPEAARNARASSRLQSEQLIDLFVCSCWASLRF